MVEVAHKFKGHLNQYGLLRTLGQGAFSKVKLCIDTQTNKKYAIKIHKADDPKID
jgi:serine/threonine protein kinase